jgi:hypothetical protein
MGIPHLALSDAQQGFLIPVVALDLPAVKIVLHQSLQTQLQIGTDEESRLAIEQLGTVPEPVAQRFNHHKLERTIGARFSPVQRAQNLHGDFAELAGGEAADVDDGDWSRL